MQLELFDILLILGIIQGVLLSVILLTHKSNQQANRLLGLVMLFLSVEILSMLISKIGIVENVIYLVPIFFSLPFIYVPILFLYVKELTADEKFERYDLLHFLPLVICLCFIAAIYLGNNIELKIFLLGIEKGSLLFAYILNNIKPVYAVVYVFAMLLYIRRYNKKLKNSFSNLDKINLNWLKNLSIALITITAIVVTQNVSEFIFNEKSALELYLFASIVILIYMIGYFGLKQPEIFSQTVEENISKTENIVKYQKSGLDDKTAEKYLKNLLNYMEKEKPYLNGDLTLQELAGRCGVSVHHLSEIINSKLNQSYYDFVNRYRVEEFKIKLNDPANDKFTILSIAFDCGFNSKSSFNTLFKKFTGTTPSNYRKSLGNMY